MVVLETRPSEVSDHLQVEENYRWGTKTGDLEMRRSAVVELLLAGPIFHTGMQTPNLCVLPMVALETRPSEVSEHLQLEENYRWGTKTGYLEMRRSMVVELLLAEEICRPGKKKEVGWHLEKSLSVAGLDLLREENLARGTQRNRLPAVLLISKTPRAVMMDRR
jgi:hypothetical protein